MIKSKYKPYPKYKPSGVEWIGEIPEGWETNDFKFIFKYQTGGTPRSSNRSFYEGDLIWVTIADLGKRQIFSSKECLNTKGVQEANIPISLKGSLLISFKLSPGIVSFAGADLYTNEAIATILPTDRLVDLNYWYYVFQNYFVLNANENIYGAKLFNQRAIKNSILSLPPLPEQKAIAAFLDRETERINGIIAKQTRMIELLKEKRSALITQAVTKGLSGLVSRTDADFAEWAKPVEYKPSGVEWIGDIPEGWEVRRFRFSVRYNLKTLSDGNTSPNYEIEYLDIGNVDREGKIISTEKMLFCDAPSRARRIAVNDNTIISTVRTYLKAIAYLSDVPDNLIVSTGFAVVSCNANSVSKFFYYLFRSEYFIQNVERNSKGVGYPAITPSQSPSNLADIQLTLPPLAEQKAIASFLDRETVKINTMVGKIQKQIELLNEYKQSLITHAVTGKIDVRGEV